MHAAFFLLSQVSVFSPYVVTVLRSNGEGTKNAPAGSTGKQDAQNYPMDKMGRMTFPRPN
jgi:hypothetical protein